MSLGAWKSGGGGREVQNQLLTVLSLQRVKAGGVGSKFGGGGSGFGCLLLVSV